MLNKIKKLGKDELIMGSFVLIVTMGIYNFLNYLFQMSMARMLGPADYGVLAVLMSFVYIFGIPSEAVQTIITRYVGKFNVRKREGMIKDLLLRSLRKGALFSLIFFAIFSVLAIFISMFLRIEFWLIILTGVLIFYSFEIPILKGILQGKKKFAGLGLNLIAESLVKLLFSAGLVLIGLKVYGGILGILIGGLVGAIVAFIMIKKVFHAKRESEDFRGIYRYNLPLIISITAIVLLYSLDVIMAKGFFDAQTAGQYAFVSLIGKVILFSSLAVGKAMFPISSERFTVGKKTNDLFKKSLMITFIISLVALFFCFSAPETIIRIISLGSSQYLAASNVLFILGLAFSLAAFSNVTIMYGLSINKIRRSSVLFLFVVALEVIALSIFNSNLVEFSVSVTIVNFIMLLLSIVLVFGKWTKQILVK
jgi:O-antigen/teichoic acid export membrane protein